MIVKLFQGFIFIYLFICVSVCVCVHLSIRPSLCMYIKAIGAPGAGVPDVNELPHMGAGNLMGSSERGLSSTNCEVSLQLHDKSPPHMQK